MLIRRILGTADHMVKQKSGRYSVPAVEGGFHLINRTTNWKMWNTLLIGEDLQLFSIVNVIEKRGIQRFCEERYVDEYNELMNQIRDLANKQTPVYAKDIGSDGHERWQCP